MFRTALLASIFSIAALGAASAAPITYAMTIYNGNNPTPGSEFDAYETALPGAGSIFSTTAVYTGSYTGTVDWNSPPGANTIAGFIGTGTGTATGTLPTLTLSGGGFTTTTGIELTFTAPTNETVTISHDDGVSLFSGSTNLLPAADANPTTETDATAMLAAGQSYTLYYIEANGLPADLNITAVPEPASLALLGAGLFGLGLIRRRRGKAS